MVICLPSRGPQGSKAGMVGSRGQERRDRAAGDRMPFLGALVAFALSLILTLVITGPLCIQCLGPQCAGVCMHTDMNGATGKEPGAEGGS